MAAPEPTHPPSTARDILRFIVLTAITSVISPSIDLLSLKLGGFISWNDILSLWITSWEVKQNLRSTLSAQISCLSPSIHKYDTYPQFFIDRL
ncbi:MAG: hypothetical protein E6J74_39205 [Deltaproteobacteria bacterium]|nr:MAG: hypothetical protein E6J74_39205 [Deltaproteobacteria bacterium]